MASRRSNCHQTCESVLLQTLRYRHHHRLLVVDELDPCDAAAPVSTCRARRCHSRRSSVRRPWMRLLARPQCSHAAGAKWTWMRLCRSSIQLPRPAYGPCDGAAPVSESRARHCSRPCLSVRRSLMVVQACRQPTASTTHVHCLSTCCHRSFPSTRTPVSCRRWLTRSRSMWLSRAVVDAVPTAVTDIPVGYVPTATVYHIHAQCNSVNCSVSWC